MPAFLITIDTEGDDVWSRPEVPTTENSAYLGRFQALAEQHGLKPTYLTNWEMSNEPRFVEMARDALARGHAEVGMHLHGWHSPPFDHVLTDRDWYHGPYLIEYPPAVIDAKVGALTHHPEEVFETAIVSHRAGRWTIDTCYVEALLRHGYAVDCSVTPHVSWSATPGSPSGQGGSDYLAFPEGPYYIDPGRPGTAGHSVLLEVPMTVRPGSPPMGVRQVVERLPPRSVLAQAIRRFYPEVRWLRPNGRNLRQMLRLLDEAVDAGAAHVEFMLHSSEFMPNGSPTFRSAQDIEKLYSDLQRLFAAAERHFVGRTLAEFAAEFQASSAERLGA